ncbi:hypothetical protein KIPB_007477, partial [Kipferlia bialata]
SLTVTDTETGEICTVYMAATSKQKTDGVRGSVPPSVGEYVLFPLFTTSQRFTNRGVSFPVQLMSYSDNHCTQTQDMEVGMEKTTHYCVKDSPSPAYIAETECIRGFGGLETAPGNPPLSMSCTDWNRLFMLYYMSL